MIGRLAIASIAFGLLLLTGGVFLSEGYSVKRGFLESLPEMRVRLTADERLPWFSQIEPADAAGGQVLDFEGRLIQFPAGIRESELNRMVATFSPKTFEPLKPGLTYLFEERTGKPGTTIALGPFLAVASALVIIGAAVLLGVHAGTRSTVREPISRAEETPSHITKK